MNLVKLTSENLVKLTSENLVRFTSVNLDKHTSVNLVRVSTRRVCAVYNIDGLCTLRFVYDVLSFVYTNVINGLTVTCFVVVGTQL